MTKRCSVFVIDRDCLQCQAGGTVDAEALNRGVLKGDPSDSRAIKVVGIEKLGLKSGY